METFSHNLPGDVFSQFAFSHNLPLGVSFGGSIRSCFDKAIWIKQQRVVLTQLQQREEESVQPLHHRFDHKWRGWYQLDHDAPFDFVQSDSI